MSWVAFLCGILRPVSVSEGADPSAVGRCRRAKPGTAAGPTGGGAAEVTDPSLPELTDRAGGRKADRVVGNAGRGGSCG